MFSTTFQPSSKNHQLVFWVAFLVLSLIVSLFLWLFQFVYPVDDDYCYIRDIRNSEGLFDYVNFWWSNWSGRWVGAVLRYFYFINFGFQTSWLLPVGLLFSVVSCCMLITRGLYGKGITGLTAGLLAGIIFFLTVGSPGNLFFWVAAGFTYTVGYLFLGLMFYCCTRVIESKGNQNQIFIVVGCVSAFVACGFSEVQAIVPPIFCIVLAFSCIARIRAWAFITIAAFLGITLNLFAPGPHARRDAVGTNIELFELFSGAFLYGLRLLIPTLLVLGLITCHPTVRGYVSYLGREAIERLSLSRARILTIAVLTYPFIISAALFWSIESGGPARARSFALLLLIASWPIIFEVIRWPSWFKKFPSIRWGQILTSIFGILILLSINMPDYIQDAFGGRASHAAEISRQRSDILEAANPNTDVVVPPFKDPPKTIPITQISPDTQGWVNICVADAYTVRSVKIPSGNP